jgi:hypothetical protein
LLASLITSDSIEFVNSIVGDDDDDDLIAIGTSRPNAVVLTASMTLDPFPNVIPDSR